MTIKITEGDSLGQIKVDSNPRPMPKGTPPALKKGTKMNEKQVPLHELLASVPKDHRLVIHGEGKCPSSTSIPVGRFCHEASKELEKQFELRLAVRRLLEDLNARHPDKNPREWSCPHMQALDDMTCVPEAKEQAKDALARIENYLENGGLWNPEMMEHEKVRDLISSIKDLLEMIVWCRDELIAARKIYVVIGETENVGQDEIGGNFVPHPKKEIVSVFSKREDAENFVKKNKLKKPERKSYGDTSFYKGGYYEMEVEEHEVE